MTDFFLGSALRNRACLVLCFREDYEILSRIAFWGRPEPHELSCPFYESTQSDLRHDFILMIDDGESSLFLYWDPILSRFLVDLLKKLNRWPRRSYLIVDHFSIRNLSVVLNIIAEPMMLIFYPLIEISLISICTPIVFNFFNKGPLSSEDRRKFKVLLKSNGVYKLRAPSRLTLPSLAPTILEDSEDPNDEAVRYFRLVLTVGAFQDRS